MLCLALTLLQHSASYMYCTSTKHSHVCTLFLIIVAKLFGTAVSYSYIFRRWIVLTFKVRAQCSKNWKKNTILGGSVLSTRLQCLKFWKQSFWLIFFKRKRKHVALILILEVIVQPLFCIYVYICTFILFWKHCEGLHKCDSFWLPIYFLFYRIKIYTVMYIFLYTINFKTQIYLKQKKRIHVKFVMKLGVRLWSWERRNPFPLSVLYRSPNGNNK